MMNGSHPVETCALLEIEHGLKLRGPENQERAAREAAKAFRGVSIYGMNPDPGPIEKDRGRFHCEAFL